MPIDIPEQTIAVNGEIIDSRQIYYVKFNKPAGYVCAMEDARHPTVMDILPPEFRTMGVGPVGRLDKDTEGFYYCPMTAPGPTALSTAKTCAQTVLF